MRRYGKTATLPAAVITCLWHGVFGARPVQIVLVRDHAKTSYDLALATTDLGATPAGMINATQAGGASRLRWKTRNKSSVPDRPATVATAVHHTIPFTLACQSIAIVWYATAGHHPADVAEHRARAPWYSTKAEPSTADMIAKLRRVLIAAKYRPVHPVTPTPAEIHAIRLAWDDAAA